MYMETQIIRFTDSADEELSQLTKEMRVGSILAALASQSSIPNELKENLRDLMLVLSDLFGSSLPGLAENPIETLRTISRDINLGRILKERGLFRLHRLLRDTVTIRDDATGRDVVVPAWATLINPETGSPYTRQEDFLGWFCEQSHVARSLVFMRMATIDKLRDLGIPLEEAYHYILSKPFAIREALNTVAVWDKGMLLGVAPDVAERLVEKMLPERVEEARDLVNRIKNSDPEDDQVSGAREQLRELTRPAIANMIREVAEHDSVKGAMDFVRHDIAARPEIKYRWNNDIDCLEIEYTRKGYDPKGTEYIIEILTIPMLADIPLPVEVKRDLSNRLPLKNREVLDG